MTTEDRIERLLRYLRAEGTQDPHAWEELFRLAERAGKQVCYGIYTLHSMFWSTAHRGALAVTVTFIMNNRTTCTTFWVGGGRCGITHSGELAVT